MPGYLHDDQNRAMRSVHMITAYYAHRLPADYDVAIIGAGNIGAALARTFARHRRSAVIANTRGPDSFKDLAKEVAPWVRATTLDEALDAGVLVLAIPFASWKLVR